MPKRILHETKHGISSKTKNTFGALVTVFALLWGTSQYLPQKGWSLMEFIISLAKQINPSLNWTIADGYRIEGKILGNFFVVFSIIFFILLIKLIKSYINDRKDAKSDNMSSTGSLSDHGKDADSNALSQQLSERDDVLINEIRGLREDIKSFIGEVKK